MERGERFALFVQELNNVAPAASYEEARHQLESILNEVEDRYSGVPYQPDNWQSDGRLYPPADDYERKSPFSDARVFRTRGHYVLLASNGAIKISSAKRAVDAPDAEVVLDKPGKDGRRCPN